VLYIQATQPAGRPLAHFTSVSELLRALRDAIKVHRSLFLDGNILHRDVSESNIIITDSDKNDGLAGSLIDLELGTIVENGKNTRTGLKRMTGTLKFMAIEVLELGMSGARPDLQHTYRHDLESFFYVFLSICVSYGWDRGKAPKIDPFRSWYIGNDYLDNMRAKRGAMERGGFKTVPAEFSPRFEIVKDLAWSLRDVLFLRGELRTETPSGDASILYDRMTAAFDRAIGECTE
jgi:serine/threonine protein kinase